jgi:hypothetical protein
MPARHTDLIPRLIDDDPTAWAVHRDALLEAGDPRGALAAEQTGAPIAHAALPAHQRQRIDAHGLAGPMKRPSAHRLTWQNGYWHGYGNWGNRQLDRYWDALFGHESAAFLRRVSLRWVPPEVLLKALQSHRPPIRYLHWNERDEPVELDPFFDALPHLTALHLWRPGRFDGGPRAPLLELAVNTGEAPDEPGRTGSLYTDLQRLAAAGGLRELSYFEAWGVGSLAWVPAVLAHTTPATIKLAGSVEGTVIPALVETDAFARAESLVLEGFWPDDDALEVLIGALEQREAPLASYRSTGRVLDERWRTRLEAAVGSVRASG